MPAPGAVGGEATIGVDGEDTDPLTIKVVGDVRIASDENGLGERLR